MKKIMNKNIVIGLVILMNITGTVYVYLVNNTRYSMLVEVNKELKNSDIAIQEKMRDKDTYRLLLEKEQNIDNIRTRGLREDLEYDIDTLRIRIDTLEKELRK